LSAARRPLPENMILTVTANTSLERSVFVPRLEPNRVIRVSRHITSPSGKGIDVSLVLQELGVPNVALACVAGDFGHIYQKLLQRWHINADLVWTDGETRINVIVIGEEEQSQTTLSDDTLIFTDAHVRNLLDKFAAHVTCARCVTIGGSLPRTAPSHLYAQMIAQTRAHNVPVILDATGPSVHAWLASGPTWFKPNRAELAFALGRPAGVLSFDEALAGVRALRARYNVNVLASLDHEGALALTDAQAWRIHPLRVPVVSASGAGDALVAGLAVALARREPIENGLRLGTAAAAATVMKPGTAECDRADVERLVGQVVLERIEIP
jgi:1-phosphofructokinase family hexose kinase